MTNLRNIVDIVQDLIDPDTCWFDHDGGCQAHGYLSLEPGEMCPQAEARLWLERQESAVSDQTKRLVDELTSSIGYGYMSTEDRDEWARRFSPPS